jgi:hypothetical protein
MFASSFYLADAAGLVRITLHDHVPGAMPIIRGAFVVPPELLVKLCQATPDFLARQAQAREQMATDAARPAAPIANDADSADEEARAGEHPAAVLAD